MYMVYWTEGAQQQAQSRAFGTEELKDALHFMEALRSRQRQGEPVCFVTMCSEHPHSVGHPGVAETGADYNWKKRRR
jgi:hypothetical protein